MLDTTRTRRGTHNNKKHYAPLGIDLALLQVLLPPALDPLQQCCQLRLGSRNGRKAMVSEERDRKTHFLRRRKGNAKRNRIETRRNKSNTIDQQKETSCVTNTKAASHKHTTVASRTHNSFVTNTTAASHTYTHNSCVTHTHARIQQLRHTLPRAQPTMRTHLLLRPELGLLLLKDCQSFFVDAALFPQLQLIRGALDLLSLRILLGPDTRGRGCTVKVTKATERE